MDIDKSKRRRPPGPPPRFTTRVLLRLTPEQKKSLDTIAASRETTTADLLRSCVDHLMTQAA